MRALAGVVLTLTLGGIWTASAGASVPIPPRVTVHVERCPDYADVLACASDEEIFVPKGAGPFVYWHEIGHLFDAQVLTDAHRAGFARLTRDWRLWWANHEFLHCLYPEPVGPDVVVIGEQECPEHVEYDPPGERFADAYAICAMQASGRPRNGVVLWTRRGRPINVGPSVYGYEARWRVHRRVCQLIWNAAGLRFDIPAPRPRRP